MGNDQRFGDKKRGANHEWGSMGRKMSHHARKHQLDEAAIQDSIESTEYEDDLDLEWCDHDLDENGWCPCDDAVPRRPAKRRKKASRKWCRRKEGREHKMTLVRTYAFYTWEYTVHACEVCGYRSRSRIVRRR